MKKHNIITLILILTTLVSSVSAYASEIEGTTPMYDVNGNTAYIPNSQLEAHHKIGWYYAPVMLMYSPNGSSTIIAKSDFWSYKSWGWYEYPITTVYDSSCTGKVIPKTEILYWQSLGWYETNWRKAYADILYDFLKNLSNDDNTSPYYDPSFNFVYIDNDSIPELITRQGTYRMAKVSIYTYKNGRVYQQQSYTGDTEFGMFGILAYAPGKGFFSDGYMNWGYESYAVYQLSTDFCPQVYSSESNFGTGDPVYYKVNGKYVDEYTYDISDNEYAYGFVDGFGSYYYKLNYSNIKSATWY